MRIVTFCNLMHILQLVIGRFCVIFIFEFYNSTQKNVQMIHSETQNVRFLSNGNLQNVYGWMRVMTRQKCGQV